MILRAAVMMLLLQVVRHERASIKADIWSYGILIWELISGEDITEYQPLSISRQVSVCDPLAVLVIGISAASLWLFLT
jgi:hypothetical protein